MNVRASLKHHQQIFGLEIPQAGGELAGRLGNSEHLPKPTASQVSGSKPDEVLKNADSGVPAKRSTLAYPRAAPGNLPT